MPDTPANPPLLVPSIGGFPVVRWLAQGCALAIFLLAILGWTAWNMGQPQIASFGIGYVPMAPSTALSFMLLSIALFMRSRWTDLPVVRIPGRLCIGGVASIGALVSIQLLTGIEWGFETWLAGNQTATIAGVPTGRMAPITAMTFLLAATALWLQWPQLNPGRTPHRKTSRVVSLVLSILVFLTGSGVLFGYLAGIPFIYGSSAIPMAALTAIAFTLTGISLLVSGRLGSLLAGLLSGDMSETRSVAQERSNLRTISGLVLLLVATTIPGGLFLKQQQEANRNDIHRDLKAIGTLKMEQIVRWRRERLADASQLLIYPGIREDLLVLLARPDDPAVRARR